MSRVLRVFLIIGALLAVAIQLRPSEAASDYIALIRINGAIDESSNRFLARAIDKATDDKARLALIEIDTPGGLLSSTRSMVESILNAEIPVAVYVAPRGARAGSAGTFITAAGNFAVMAPGTNIGAASPISSTGDDIPSTLAKKINEDTQAFIRSIADVRGRNADALEETVTLARSYTAEEAIALNVVDLIASDRADLLNLVDGLTAETAAGPVIVRTQDVPIREIKKNILEQFLAILANPSVAGILISMGSLALLIEFYTAGFGPGVAGVIMLALGFLGAGQLPLNWVALGLIVFAMLLFFLEMQAPGIGVFGIGGLFSLAVGLLFLFGNFSGAPDISEPGTEVSPWVIGTLVSGAAALVLALAILARPTGGLSTDSSAGAAFIGKEGVAMTVLNPGGQISVSGQEWTASSDESAFIDAGVGVEVIGVYGDVLKVISTAPPSSAVRPEIATLVGHRGVAISDLEPAGNVRVDGHPWTAASDSEVAIKQGDPIEVARVAADVLTVTASTMVALEKYEEERRQERQKVRDGGKERGILALLGRVARHGKIFNTR